jgi:agmatine/peptidylarginine deiminase
MTQRIFVLFRSQVIFSAIVGAVVSAAAFYAIRSVPDGSNIGPAPVSAASTATTGFGPALGVDHEARIVGEFEHQDALMLGVNELLEYHPQTLCDLVGAIGGRMEIVALISSADQQQRTIDLLTSHQIPTDHIHFFLWPASSMWVQDFGPVISVGRELRVLDFTYQFLERDVENQLPLAFAATYGMKIEHVHLSMEGGNLLSNGRGLCLSSSSLIAENESRKYDLQKVGGILQHYFHFKQWTYMTPLIGEPTGHVDMFATFTSPTTVLVGAYESGDDPQNTALLEESARTLAEVKIDGEPLRVVRIPMPPHRDGLWRTYTNVIFANGVVLVPQYPDCCPELDRRALEIYREVLPDWQVVGINASTLIAKRGSLHCCSLNLPIMPSLHGAE